MGKKFLIAKTRLGSIAEEMTRWEFPCRVSHHAVIFRFFQDYIFTKNNVSSAPLSTANEIISVRYFQFHSVAVSEMSELSEWIIHQLFLFSLRDIISDFPWDKTGNAFLYTRFELGKQMVEGKETRKNEKKLRINSYKSHEIIIFSARKKWTVKLFRVISIYFSALLTRSRWVLSKKENKPTTLGSCQR